MPILKLAAIVLFSGQLGFTSFHHTDYNFNKNEDTSCLSESFNVFVQNFTQSSTLACTETDCTLSYS